MTLSRWIAWPLLVIPWFAVCGVLVWLCLLRFPPSGVTTYRFVADGTSPWLDAFLPGQRVTPPGLQPEGWIGQRIFHEPVYASARLPGPYDQVEVTMEARPTRQPLVEFGVLRDPATFAFEMHPFWSEALSKGWHPVVKQGVHGYVRDGVPDEALLTTDPDRLLFWHATTTVPERMDASAMTREYNVSLRGAHDLYLIPTDGEINFEFDLQDVNRKRGGSIVAIRVSRGEETVWTEAVASSGRFDTRPDQTFRKEVHIGNLKAGVYRLSLIMDDDVFIRRIATSARHWVFGSRFYVGDNVGYATTSAGLRVWTNSQHINVQTVHPEGLQAVHLGQATVKILKTHQAYPLSRLPTERRGPVTLTLPQGDVRVIGDGYVALSPETLFLPYPRRLTDASLPLEEGIDAIVTPYQQPESLGDGWWKLHTTFDLTRPLPDRLKFSLSLPAILSRNGALDIRSVQLRYERPAVRWEDWAQTLKEEIVSMLKRL